MRRSWFTEIFEHAPAAPGAIPVHINGKLGVFYSIAAFRAIRLRTTARVAITRQAFAFWAAQ